MIYENVQSNVRPQSVTVENLTDGRQRVILARNIEEAEYVADTELSQTLYQYDEAAFFLPDDRKTTAEEIEKNIDAWWEYAREAHTPPTIDERVAVLEDVIAMLIEG